MSRCTFGVASSKFNVETFTSNIRYAIWSSDGETINGFIELKSQQRASYLKKWNPNATFENVLQFDRDAARSNILSLMSYNEYGKWIESDQRGFKLKPLVNTNLKNGAPLLVNATLNDATLVNATLNDATLVNATLNNVTLVNATIITNNTFNAGTTVVMLGKEIMHKAYFEMAEQDIRENISNPYQFLIYGAPKVLWFCQDTPTQNILSKNQNGDIFVKISDTTTRKTDAEELWSVLIAHFEVLVEHYRTLGLSHFEEYAMRGVIELGKKCKLITVDRESPVHRCLSNFHEEQTGTYDPLDIHIDLIDSICNCIRESIKRGRMQTFEEIKRDDLF